MVRLFNTSCFSLASELYLLQQVMSNIQPGDFVRVVYEAMDREYGWNNIWNKEKMSIPIHQNLIGIVMSSEKYKEIGRFSPEGIPINFMGANVRNGSRYFLYPYYSLRKISI